LADGTFSAVDAERTSSNQRLSAKCQPGHGADYSMSAPRVVLYDVILPKDVDRQSLGNLFAVMQHDHTIRKAANSLHDVLDDDDRDSLITQLLQQRSYFGHFAAGQSRHDLVKQQQFRTGRDGTGDL